MRQQEKETSSHKSDISNVEDSGTNRTNADVKEVSRVAICPTIDEIPDATSTDERKPKDLEIADTRCEKSVCEDRGNYGRAADREYRDSPWCGKKCSQSQKSSIIFGVVQPDSTRKQRYPGAAPQVLPGQVFRSLVTPNTCSQHQDN